MNKNKLNLKNALVADINKGEASGEEKDVVINEVKTKEVGSDVEDTKENETTEEVTKEVKEVGSDVEDTKENETTEEVTKEVPVTPEVQEKVVPDAVVVSQIKPVEVVIPNKVTTVTQNVLSEFEDRKSFIIQNGTNNEKSLITTLDTYVTVMKPRAPIDPAKVGVVTQYNLYKTLEWILDSVPQHEFKGLFSIVNMYFKQYKSHCFAPEQVARFSEHWGYDKDELAAFLGLVDLLAGSVGETREITVPKINFKNLFDYKKISEEAQQRISIYYNL